MKFAKQMFTLAVEHEGGLNIHLQARIDPQHLVKNGDRIRLAINSEQMHLFCE